MDFFKFVLKYLYGDIGAKKRKFYSTGWTGNHLQELQREVCGA
ncbi:MAG: hypothetical protein GQF41_4570 [Candidatus Rifleibacterium amylolyticum]|nr:MAG: hypothetical protein GQF41_4570 [Candidatus Rifleibacterium amylolyticum]